MIVLVSQYKFPEGDAGSVRLMYFAKQLQVLGHDVLVVGYGSPTAEVCVYKGVKYVSLRKNINKYRSYLLYNHHLIILLKQLGVLHTIDSIILGTVSINVFLSLKRYCKKNNVVLIKDIVEWYSKKQFKHWYLSYSYISKIIENLFIVDQSVKVIAISNYLLNIYVEKNIETERIPVFFDQNDYPFYVKNNSSLLRLLYAGSPGKKDCLGFILKNLSLLADQELNLIRLVLIGLKQDDVIKLCADEKIDYSKMERVLIVKGIVTRDSVLEEYLISDFSLLIRDSDAIYAKAGFPTKVVESLSMSTPVICNISSDLNIYLEDMKNSLIVGEMTSDSFNGVILRALGLTLEEKSNLSKYSKETAVKYFDLNSYEKSFLMLLNR